MDNNPIQTGELIENVGNMWVLWQKNKRRIKGREMLEEIEKHKKAPEEKNTRLVIHTWERGVPYITSRYIIAASCVIAPNSPDEKYVFYLADIREKDRIVKRLVWPVRHADEGRGLLPLLGVQKIWEGQK